jgi:beta-glucanase (GH16 family)
MFGAFPSAQKFEKWRDDLVQEYHDYLAYAESEELHRFEYLNQYVHSTEFEEKENDPDTDQTEIDALKKELKELHKSKQLKKYFNAKANEGKFAPMVGWELLFEDDFSGNRLDTKKWLTRHYWGEKLLKRTYSLTGNKHCTTDGKNVSVADSSAIIETRREQAQGIVWNPFVGFIPDELEYTSGVINTATSFRHQYGKIEAKVTVPRGKAYHAFWLGGEQMLPQVNIFKYVKGRFYLENFWGNPADPNGVNNDTTVVPGAFTGKNYIFSLEWTPSRLTWSVNGVVMKTAQRGIPNEPMYIAFGSGVNANARRFSSTIRFGIDWVRFYSRKE